MGLITSYLITTKNVEPFFNSLITAKAPSTFTQKVLESLEFKSTNDRLFIRLLKGLGFLDANAAPTERYYRYLDQSQSKQVLAEAIREAYGDLFAVNINAQELSVQEVKNKLRTLTQGRSSDKLLSLMANTFKALAAYADLGSPSKRAEGKSEEVDAKPSQPPFVSPPADPLEEETSQPNRCKTELHYNIQIHLPESRDQAVYDALFRSLKKHLF